MYPFIILYNLTIITIVVVYRTDTCTPHILKIRFFPLGICIDKFVKDLNTFVDFIP